MDNNTNSSNDTMNSYNSNDDNTMNYSNHDSSSLLAEAVPSTPAMKRQPGTSSALYKLAARNLREYHGVPSMTALKLEKTVALLALPPRRLVVQGLAPRRLLKGGEGGSPPLVLAGENSDKGKEELREAETGELMDENINNDDDSSSDGQEEEEEVGHEDKLFSDDSNSTYDSNGDSIDNTSDESKGEADGNGNDRASRPIHAALVAGGINLRPRETRPLLRALGVNPHRLVKLGLVKREVVLAMPGRRRGGPGSRRGGGPGQHLHANGPRKAGMSGRRCPPHGPPHVLGGPSSGCGPSRPLHSPPRGRSHGAGHHTLHMGEKSDEGIFSSVDPLTGPGRRSPPPGLLYAPGGGPSSGCGPSGPLHGPPRGRFHGAGHHTMHMGEEGEEEGIFTSLGPHAGPGRRGPPPGPPLAPGRGPSFGCGPPGPLHGPPRGLFLGAGHHTMHVGEESEEEGIFSSVGPHSGPGHRGPRHQGGPFPGPPHGPAHHMPTDGRHGHRRGPPGGGEHGHGHRYTPHGHGHGRYGGGLHYESEGKGGERLVHGGGARGFGQQGPRPYGGGMGRPFGPPQGPPHGPPHGMFHEGASGAPPGMMARPRHGSPSVGVVA